MHEISTIVVTKVASEKLDTILDQIVAIYRESWLETYPNDELGITKEDLQSNFTDMEQVTTEWRGKIKSEARKVFIAQEGAELIGFCVIKFSEEHNELEYIYLLPRCTGNGVGKKLMEPALAALGNQKPIELFGAAYNKTAIGFYKKYGFELTDDQLDPKPLANGKELPTMRMVKPAATS